MRTANEIKKQLLTPNILPPLPSYYLDQEMDKEAQTELAKVTRKTDRIVNSLHLHI